MLVARVPLGAVARHLGAVAGLPHLCYLSGSLAGNGLKVKGTKMICEAIVKMPNLTSLKCAE